MNNIYNNLKTLTIGLIGLLMGIAGCSPESSDLEIGPVPEASFIIEIDNSNINTFTLTSTTEGAFLHLWDTGNGYVEGNAINSAYFPDKGEYEIRLIALSSGGVDTSNVQTVVVETSDPVAGNLINGGKMEAGDEQYWNTFVIGSGVNFAIANGAMVGTGGSWGHAGFYQAVEVVANKTYRFSATVSGSGASDTWYEVYFGTDQPTDGQDYTSGGTQIGLNTWSGCGNSEFSGNVLNIGCVGDLVGTDGTVTFDTSGTIYFVVKSGGSYLGDTGLAMDNIELRGTR